MGYLNVFVCENYSVEFAQIVKNEGFDDVAIKPFPCMCESKKKKGDTSRLIEESITNDKANIVLCGKHCEFIGLIPEGVAFDIRTSNYCFLHMANEAIVNYILDRGGYIIGLGWLKKWRENIASNGFDRATAKSFYGTFCKELVFFDAGIDSKALENMKELSDFLALPYVVISFELESLKLMLRCAVNEWRLHDNQYKHTLLLSEVQSQCAEYAAILDLLGKIASYTNKRDTIQRIKEIFIMVLGAQNFKFWSTDGQTLPEEITNLFSDSTKAYCLLENRFCIMLEYNNKVFGALDVGEFLFPQYIERYLNFAIEISRVSALVLFNIEQYEKLIESEKELQFLSFHDSLTGLYNRAYVKEFIKEAKSFKSLVIFVIDIDKLKHANDTFGHSEGDKLICAVATLLKHSFRDTDIVARMGGDEFVVIVPEGDRQMATLLKARINQSVLTSNKKNLGRLVDISVSVGFAVSEDETHSIETLMHKADELMYHDKLKRR